MFFVEDCIILEKIRNIPRTIKAELMDDEMKKEVLQLEMNRLDEMIPLVNQAVNDAFEEEEQIVIIRDASKYYEEDTVETLTLRNEAGQIVGEEIFDEEELEDLKDDPDVYFMSDNFVTYNSLSTPGQKQHFVIESPGREFLTDEKLEDCVKSLVVSLPSTDANNYIKDYYQLTDEDIIDTVIVGFTPK